MERIRVFLILSVILFTVCGVHASSIIYVAADEPNEPGSGTFNDPFGRIQDAIDAAVEGDIIEVRPGRYTGAGNYELDPSGKSITVRSCAPGDGVVADTIIDPNGLGRGFYFHSGEDANCIIEGLTIRNAYAGGKGAGIYCYNSSPTIANCIISDNRAGTHGGGIFCQNSSPQIRGCVISGNISANDGGAIEWWYGSAVLKQCVIFDNEASGSGGGVDFFGCDDAVIENCTFAANTAYRGGALFCWSSNCTVTNSIFRGSNASDSGLEIGIYTGGVTVGYSNIEGGQEAVSNESGTLDWADGNFETEPDFVLFDIAAEALTWDFRLRSEFGRWDKNIEQWVKDSTTSPCIDAGDPDSDYSGEPWPHGGRINMGGYGGTSQASKYGNIADFDISGAVDAEDFMELVSRWLAEDKAIVNLDMAGAVDIFDFAVFAENWLWAKE